MNFSNRDGHERSGLDLDLTQSVIRMDRLTPVHDKLAAIAAALPSPPAWLDAWRHSTRGRTSMLSRPEDEAGPEERLAVWKAARDAGDLPDDAAFRLVADETHVMAMVRIIEALEVVEHRLEEAWSASGLEALRPEQDQAWVNYEEYPKLCPEDWDRRFAEELRANGEEGAARLYLEDRARFKAKAEAGFAFFQPPAVTEVAPVPPEPRPAPSWADEFREDLAGAGMADGIDMARVPFDLWWNRLGRHWQASVAFPPVEWVGGPRDGEVRPMATLIDVGRLLRIFGRIKAVAWVPGACGCCLPSLSVLGSWRGRRVSVRVYGDPLDAVPAKVSAADGGPADA